MKASFHGFSIPEGAWLPPELLELLPQIRTLSELKVTLAAIAETLRVGGTDQVISLSDFEVLTGLDRKSVSAGIGAALKRGTMIRRRAGNSWLYRLKFTSASPAATNRGKFPLANRGEFPPNRGKIPPIGGEFPLSVDAVVDVSLSDSNQNKQQHQQQHAAMLAEMRNLGVVQVRAQQLIQRYDLDYLQQKLEYVQFAVRRGLADNPPGWFVASVKEDWPAPLGFEEPGPEPGSEEDRMRYIRGKYADLIKH
jgi:hypothetical protein